MDITKEKIYEDISAERADMGVFINHLASIAETTNMLPEEYLTHPNPDIRIDAIRALVDHWTSKEFLETSNEKDIPNTDFFFPFLEDVNPVVRLEALICIYRMDLKYEPKDLNHVELWNNVLENEASYTQEMAVNIIAQSDKHKAYFKPIIEKYRKSNDPIYRKMAGQMLWCGGFDIYEDSLPILEEMLTDTSPEVRERWKGHLTTIKSLTPLEVFKRFSQYSQDQYVEIHQELAETFLYAHRKDLVRKNPDVQAYLFNNMLNGQDDWLVETSFYTAAKSFSSLNINYAKTIFKALDSEREKNNMEATFWFGFWVQDLYWQFYNHEWKHEKEAQNILNLLLEDDDPQIRGVAQYVAKRIEANYNKYIATKPKSV